MIEFRYAKAHHQLHHTLVSPEEIAHVRKKLLRNKHSLLDCKASILNSAHEGHIDHTSGAELIAQLTEVLAKQRSELHNKSLTFAKSHERYMQLGAYDLHKFGHTAMTPELATTHVMYLKAHSWFEQTELAEVEHGMHVMQSMEHPFMFSVIGAAHDATNMGKLHATLDQQQHILLEAAKTQRVDVQNRVLSHMQLCFEDELQLLSLLHHQQVHTWDAQ